uniref:hypothetical protein n=1 Tax=Lachnoclostridium phocaeense TaxID=1871021 RepID=UPI0026DAA757|nr:hypothetical protein [Lachnoclostridium phocaeense]
MIDSYDDIIGLPHHVSKKHPQMPLEDRAAQFSPFAALSGYDSVIQETGRIVDKEILLDEEALESLDRKFKSLLEHVDESQEVKFTVFEPDEKKAGGSYQRLRGIIKKIDMFNRMIILEDGVQIPMDHIVDVDSTYGE